MGNVSQKFSKIADVCNPETPPPLESANVCNVDPLPPPKNCGRPLWTAPYGMNETFVLLTYLQYRNSRFLIHSRFQICAMRNRFSKEYFLLRILLIGKWRNNLRKNECPFLFRGKPVVNFETLLFLIQQSSGTWCTQYLAAGLSTQSSVQRTLARLYKGSSCISVSKIMKFCKFKSVSKTNQYKCSLEQQE